MRTVRKLPADFESWVNEVALNFSRYIYYKRQSKRLITGYCTSCCNQVEFRITKETPQETVKHNRQGRCPLCKKAVTFKAEGRTANQTDNTAAAIMQKTPTGFVVRSFQVRKEYRDYKNPKLVIDELVRDFYDGREVTGYEYDNFKQTNRIRWCHRRSPFQLGRRQFQLDVACLYTRNLRAVLADTELKYCCIYELAKNIDKFNIFNYLNAYITYPAYEYLVKLGLYRFVIDNIRVNGNYAELDFKGSSWQEILGINREQLQQMQRLNGKAAHYKMIRSTGEVGVTLKDEQLQRLLQLELEHDRVAEILRYVTPQKFINYINKCQKKWELPKHGQYNFRSIIKDIVIYWDDYLTNCALLGYDMKNTFILFPRNLKARHDEVMKVYNKKGTAVLNKAIAALYETLQSRYGFTWEGMILRPPTSMNEIVADGQTLHHCAGSGSYGKNMAKGKIAVLLVRRADAPDKPYFTMELKNNKVIQCRGYNNCGMTDEVKNFVSRWQKKKLKQSTES
jgi:hypothetical protein